MKNIYMADITHEYYIGIAQNLLNNGYDIKMVSYAEENIYKPKSLKKFLKEVDPYVLTWDEYNYPERFDKIFNPDYSIFSIEFFSEIAYYEKLFLLATDRISFTPISQIERVRMFHKYIAHAYNIFKKLKIDSIIFFGTPHGPWSISILALAKVIEIDILYTDWVGISPNLSTIENSIEIRKTYTIKQAILGKQTNPEDRTNINEVISNKIYKDFDWTATKHINKINKVIKRIIALSTIKSFSRYLAPEFIYNNGNRRGIKYVTKYLRYLYEMISAIRFYDKNSTKIIKEKALVLFLHFQPEASTMPMGYVFSDQLLVLEIILSAAPKDLNIYIKEHPYTYEYPAQDRHERSKKFYQSLLRDPRVKFLDRKLSTKNILNLSQVKYIASICGSVSWEAIRIGKPCIIFGWAWFASCKSCYSVDSKKSLRKALEQIDLSDNKKVNNDLNDFLHEEKNRYLYGVGTRSAFSYINTTESEYQKYIENISDGIVNSLKESKKKVNYDE